MWERNAELQRARAGMTGRHVVHRSISVVRRSNRKDDLKTARFCAIQKLPGNNTDSPFAEC
jgi:hypothetical protein